MPELWSNIGASSGNTATKDLRVPEEVGALILKLPNLLTLANETITISKQTKDGKEHIAQDVPLDAFVALSTYGNPAIVEDPADDYPFCLCELSQNGNIALEKSDSLYVKMSGLNSNSRYEVQTLKYPVTAHDTVYFDVNSIMEAEARREFNVEAHDMLYITDLAQLEEMEFYYSNGKNTTYSPLNLKAISADVDPDFYVSKTNQETHTFPLKGLVVSLEGVTRIVARNVPNCSAYKIVTYQKSVI